MPNSVRRQVLSAEETASLLGVSRGTIYESVRSGRMACVRVGDRVLIDRQVVEDLLGRPIPDTDLPDISEVWIPTQMSTPMEAQLKYALSKALHLSVRTFACDGKLHLYGGPTDRLRGNIMQPANDTEVALIETFDAGGMCTINPTSRHMQDEHARYWARSAELTHNIWRDRLQ